MQTALLTASKSETICIAGYLRQLNGLSPSKSTAERLFVCVCIYICVFFAAQIFELVRGIA